MVRAQQILIREAVLILASRLQQQKEVDFLAWTSWMSRGWEAIRIICQT